MQSSSAQVTMEPQNRKRAPAWTKQEVLDLIAVWGEKSVLSELRSSFRNAKTFVKISQGMKDRDYNRDPQQCHVKLKELRQAYQKTQEANAHLGSEPQTCCFYDELHVILGGASTTPHLYMDSCKGVSRNRDDDFGDKEDDKEGEVEDSAHQASGETGLPNSHEQPGFLDLEGREGTSAANVSTLPLASPCQRLAQIRRQKTKALAMKCSPSLCSPPKLKEPSRMRGCRQCQSPGKHKMNPRTDGWSNRRGGGSVMRGDRM
ncbi:uncharacterized protein LOC141990712 [Natator depressus]|uniref:uncharacterized protein LOC141990712 n=1 Tax=Natator depressus TaxID=27790 RepID=UPI003EBFA8D6